MCSFFFLKIRNVLNKPLGRWIELTLKQVKFHGLEHLPSPNQQNKNKQASLIFLALTTDFLQWFVLFVLVNADTGIFQPTSLCTSQGPFDWNSQIPKMQIKYHMVFLGSYWYQFDKERSRRLLSNTTQVIIDHNSKKNPKKQGISTTQWCLFLKKCFKRIQKLPILVYENEKNILLASLGFWYSISELGKRVTRHLIRLGCPTTEFLWDAS